MFALCKVMSLHELASVLNISIDKANRCITKIKAEYKYTNTKIISYILEIVREKIPLLPLDIIEHVIIKWLDFYDICNIGLTCKIYYSKWRKWITNLPKCISDEIDDRTLSTFSSLTSLDFTARDSIPIQSIKSLSSLKVLNLPRTFVTNIDLADLKHLHLHTLDLSDTQVTNVSALGKVHTLDLSDTKVTDVSALGNVHTLDLSWTKVTDVSVLGGVHTLNLSCTEVTDVPALGKVHTLDL